ncbi:conserved oligomeric Golgi complex subunit 8 [Tachypleus tridentatus]|uniref:conserved oligomeric Golgi complex subunit 8 n=1 Tax=Tachypleus tridentatus TaxID=6853 RepID=UPI003FD47AA9
MAAIETTNSRIEEFKHGDNGYAADEDFLRAIFPNSSQEEFRENPDVATYLAELSSYGVQRLAQEPECLAEEKAAVLEQTQDLASENYKTFIQTAECSHQIFRDFNIVEEKLVLLLDKLPNFATKCQFFKEESEQINLRRHQASQTLSKYTQLLDILEIPQVMDTCVRNDYCEDALELAAYVRRLEKKYSSIPLVASIAREVQESYRLMLNKLLQQLRTNIELPACLKVIGFIRRMDVFSEAELRIRFLQARDAWFQSVLQNIPNINSYNHITKTIEASRVHLFDIITQYRAIFSDEDPWPSNYGRESQQNNSAIFHSWLTYRVTEFLQTLQKDISLYEGERLDSILAQCMYFGLSFSRVGADFRPLLVTVYEKVIFRKYQKDIKDATEGFEEAMQGFTLTSFPSFVNVSVLTPTSTSEDKPHPPQDLLEFYPLAKYCNSILVALNHLRLCTPLSLAPSVVQELQASLNKCVSAILNFHRAEETTFSRYEVEQFSCFCSHFANELLPYLDHCLAVVFPPERLAKTLILSTSEFNKLDNLGRLDIKSILEPMSQLLPPKDDDQGITITVNSTSTELTKTNQEISFDETSVQRSDVLSEVPQEEMKELEGSEETSTTESSAKIKMSSDNITDQAESLNESPVIEAETSTELSSSLADKSINKDETPNNIIVSQE